MKGAVALACIFGFAATATAKPAPVDSLRPPPVMLVRKDTDINVGPAGALLERDYLMDRAPGFDSGPFPCRFEFHMFAKLRLAQSCR